MSTVVSDSQNRFEWPWNALVALWLMFIMLFGGTGFPSQTVQMVMTASSLVLLAVGFWRLRVGLPSGAAVVAAILAVLSLALVLAHLVPMPYDLWRSLPGREIVVRAFDAIGKSPDNMALSLSPVASRTTALGLLPPLAAFICVLSLDKRFYWILSLAIVACAIIGSLIGIVQASQGAASGLYFYNDPGPNKYATGTFANKNFFAAQLYTSIPFLAALAMALAKRWNLRPILVLVFTIIYIGMLIAVLAAIGSRAGILLAMASVLFTFLFVYRSYSGSSLKLASGKGLLVMLVFMVVLVQVGMVGILRLAETDPLNDFRNTIAMVSFEAAKSQFPWGSGFGTFVPVYQLYETAQTIVDPYINHAHNEWLELVIEGGAPAMFLLAVFVLWVFYTLFKALRLAPFDHAHIRAACVAAVLLMLHAVVDFPFRTDALLAFFGICLGFMALATAREVRWQRPRADSAGEAPVHHVQRQPRPFQPAQTFAGRRTSTPTPQSGPSNAGD